MKRPSIGVKDFHNFHWTRRTSSRRGYGNLGEKNKFILCFFGGEENECVRGELVVMCVEMLFMESNGVQTKEHGRKLCVANSHRGVHGMISTNKPLDFLLK
jgi:hypothetical protein